MKIAAVFAFLFVGMIFGENQLTEQELEMLTIYLQNLHQQQLPEVTDYTFKNFLKPRISKFIYKISTNTFIC